jgi:BASS family bile acid:Na+ symporter
VAGRIGPGVSRTAIGLFILIIIAALAQNWVVFSSNLGSLAPVSVVLNLAMLGLGLVSGQLLGLKRREATAISIESGVQNGTLAIAVGSFVAAANGQVLPPETVPAAVYSITMYLVCVPFVVWRRHYHKGG